MDNLQQEHPAKLKSGGNGWQSVNQELIGNDVRTMYQNNVHETKGHLKMKKSE